MTNFQENLTYHMKTTEIDNLCTACATLQYFNSFIILNIPFVSQNSLYTELLLGSDFSSQFLS